MLIELIPANSKNGLIGKYRLPTGDKYFAVLLFDNTPDDKREEAIAKVSAQITELHQGEQQNPDTLKLTKIAQRNFTTPEQVIFESNTEIQDTLQDRLNSENDTLFICPDKETYVQACAAIGITRADHLASAELHAICAPKNTTENYVASQIPTLVEGLNQSQKLTQKRLNPKYGFNEGWISAFKETIQYRRQFIEALATATKFRLGYTPLTDYDKICDPKKPWKFTPPFKACLFEFEIGVKPTLDSEPTYIKHYALVRDVNDHLFEAHIVRAGQREHGEPIDLIEFYITWDISGDTLKVGVTQYGDREDPDREATIRLGVNYFKCISTPIVKLNSLKTKIERVHPPKVVEKKLRGPSSYYDYHVFIPEAKTEATEPLGNEPIPRRLNKRRRHERTYKHERFTNMRGRTVWIEEKIWGDENVGVLGKEYDLSDLADPKPQN